MVSDNEKLQCAADARREAMEEPSDEERWPNGVVGMPVEEIALAAVKAIKAAQEPECRECRGH